MVTGVREMRGHSGAHPSGSCTAWPDYKMDPKARGVPRWRPRVPPLLSPRFSSEFIPMGLAGASPVLRSYPRSLCCGIQPTSSFPLQRDAELGVLETLMGTPLRPCSPPLTGREARVLMRDASLSPQEAGCVPTCVLSFLPALPMFPAL